MYPTEIEFDDILMNLTLETRLLVNKLSIDEITNIIELHYKKDHNLESKTYESKANSIDKLNTLEYKIYESKANYIDNINQILNVPIKKINLSIRKMDDLKKMLYEKKINGIKNCTFEGLNKILEQKIEQNMDNFSGMLINKCIYKKQPTTINLKIDIKKCIDTIYESLKYKLPYEMRDIMSDRIINGQIIYDGVEYISINKYIYIPKIYYFPRYNIIHILDICPIIQILIIIDSLVQHNIYYKLKKFIDDYDNDEIF